MDPISVGMEGFHGIPMEIFRLVHSCNIHFFYTDSISFK